MVSKINSISFNGINGEKVEIEVDILKGLNNFNIVGLGDAAVQESKERVRSAVKNSGFYLPNTRITVNLAPADIRKKGPIYDFAIAVGILLSSEQIDINQDFLDQTIFLGELNLNGELRHVPGAIIGSIFAKENGFKRIFLPFEDANEAAFIDGIEIFGIDSIPSFISHIKGIRVIEKTQKKGDIFENNIFSDSLNFKHIKGQNHVKRALEISAGGSHNILMNGAPGSGKTLMARALQTILPDMTMEESIEVTKIYSIANKLDRPIITKRPFRLVHHTASSVSIVGGGNSLRPGEISLAHRGVIFFDEFGEFPSNVLEVLRQPMEDKKITISRASGSVCFPSQFTLVGAMNPCPCGYYGVPNSIKKCQCSSFLIEKYRKKISGPLLDRIDLYCDVSPVDFRDLKNIEDGETSEEIKKRVEKARKLQLERFKGDGIFSNSEMSHSQIKKFCNLSQDIEKILDASSQKYGLSARSIHRIIKIGRTIADLSGENDIKINHILEAIQYRNKISKDL